MGNDAQANQFGPANFSGRHPASVEGAAAVVPHLIRVELVDPRWRERLPRLVEVDQVGQQVRSRVRPDWLRAALSKSRGGGDRMSVLARNCSSSGRNSYALRQYIGVARAGGARLEFDSPQTRGYHRQFANSLRFFSFEAPIFVASRNLRLDDHLMRYGLNVESGSEIGELIRLNDSEFIRVEANATHTAIVWSTNVSLSGLVSTLLEHSQPILDEKAVLLSTSDTADHETEVTLAKLLELGDALDTDFYYAMVPFTGFDLAWRRTPATASSRGKRYGEAGLIYQAPRFKTVIDVDYVERTGSPDVRQIARQMVKESDILRAQRNRPNKSTPW